VSAPKPPPHQPPSKQPKPAPHPAFTPELLAKCAGYTLAAQLAAGCPAPQVRPEREECPAEAVESMQWLSLDDGEVFPLVLDVNQPGWNSENGVYRTGKYTGEISKNIEGRTKGWRVEGYFWTEGKTVVGRYTKLFPPAGARDRGDRPLPREVPVCFILGGYGGRAEYGLEKREGSKPGAVVLGRTEVVRTTFGKWTQP